MRRVHAQISADIQRTPTRHAQTLSGVLGAQLWLKFENLQFTSSFKERGALAKLLSLTPEETKRGVVAASAGNHAQAVAHHARRLGIHATIVMPRTTPFIKVSNTEVLGADIVQVGDTVDAARERAAEMAQEQGLVAIPPFDDPLIIAGQGSVALELLADAPPLDAVVVPVGGGGLISGIALAVKALAPQIQVVGVQAERFCAMSHMFWETHGQQSTGDVAHPSLGPFGADTLADGIAVKTPGLLTRSIIESHVDEMLLVGEVALERACNELLELEKTVAEGAGAASLAAVIEHPDRFAGRRVACIVSGGNIDPRVMADVISRGLARTGRLARLRIDVRDLPGSLAEITRLIADTGANIVQVMHERVFLASPTHKTRLSVELATRHAQHVSQVVAALRDAGYEVDVG